MENSHYSNCLRNLKQCLINWLMLAIVVVKFWYSENWKIGDIQIRRNGYLVQLEVILRDFKNHRTARGCLKPCLTYYKNSKHKQRRILIKVGHDERHVLLETSGRRRCDTGLYGLVWRRLYDDGIQSNRFFSSPMRVSNEVFNEQYILAKNLHLRI